jgi:hypothetical protein
MAKTNLTNEEMLGISESWVTAPTRKEEEKEPDQEQQEGKAKAKFELIEGPEQILMRAKAGGATAYEVLRAIPETMGMIPHLEQAHKGLLDARAPDDSTLKELEKEELTLDERFDLKTQGSYDAYEMLAKLTDDPEEAELLRSMQSLHFPLGDAVTKKPYLEEGGAMLATEEKLDPETRKFLAGQKLGRTGSLLDSLDECVSMGKDLRQLDLRKLAEEKKLADRAAKTDPTTARNAWIRAVNGLLTMLGLANPDPEVTELILGRLDQVEAAADKRRLSEAKRRKKAKEKKAKEKAGKADLPAEPETTSEPEPTEEPTDKGAEEEKGS